MRSAAQRWADQVEAWAKLPLTTDEAGFREVADRGLAGDWSDLSPKIGG